MEYMAKAAPAALPTRPHQGRRGAASAQAGAKGALDTGSLLGEGHVRAGVGFNEVDQHNSMKNKTEEANVHRFLKELGYE